MTIFPSINTLFANNKKAGLLALAKYLTVLSCLCFFFSAAAQTTRSATGINAASIQPAVDQFRTDLGTLNPNVAGSFGSGRREINWDGVPDAFSAPNNLPANFFNVNSPRGVVFSGPGTGFQVSANAGNPTSTAVEFGNLNATYPSLFATFSAQRLFTSSGSNITDVNFFVPGTTTPAFVRGFGAVFSDVDLSNVTSIQLFDAGNNSLGTFMVPAIAGNETLSFLGVSYTTPIISRVRIISGNTILGLGINENLPATDLAIMDDFIYGEPVPVVGQSTRSATGINAASIQPAVDQFRTDLGTLNPNLVGSFGSGRREINWDGVPNALSAPNNLPANFFNVNSPRGVIFSTPGTGFQVSANAGVDAVEFGNINPTYPSLFAPFSAQRLFTALGSNITDVTFFVPGTNTPALTRGFGAIFSDVDHLNVTTSIQYFNQNNVSLGTFVALSTPGDESFTFLGVSYPTAIVSRVRITSGTAALGLNEITPGRDLVVMDDFLYGEPVAACPVINVTIPDAFALPSGVLANTVYIGYLPASSITLTAQPSGGTPPYTYTWSTGSNASSITVSPTVATTYTVTVTDANGCSGTASKTINVIDVRGGKKLDKVVICHKPNEQANTLTIGADGVADHLSHGDMLGSCAASLNTTTMRGGILEQDIRGASFWAGVYPNPSSTNFTISVKGVNNQSVEIRITDMQGRLIERRSNLAPNKVFTIGNSYQPGMYIVEMIQGSIRKQQKLIKTN